MSNKALRSQGKHGWSRSVLVHQIENQAFQRTMSSQTNFGAALDPAASGSRTVGGKR
jgi:predicted nuclease of restriction endonuclease-like (RecB) superfamily